ncbi:MAG: hypothetical protein KAU20_02005 [Nanoarchaeota archaeon]|nr:hypothetical protein [Nanoarchaeota archaeon]
MKIIICNSACFFKEALEAKADLERLGKEAITHPMKVFFRGKEVPVEEYYNARKEGWDEEIEKLKENLMREHFDKIKESDAILVLNFDKDGKKNYIGGNSLIEMGLAFALNKKIFMLNPIPEDLSYTEEIKGMKPIVINGGLERVK